MIILRGDEVDLDKKVEYGFKEYTAIEICQKVQQGRSGVNVGKIHGQCNTNQT
jgi:hypothetical protein